MKVTTDENGDIVLKEIYSGVFLETSEGNRIAVCMRDDSFEINVLPKGSEGSQWHHVDMETGLIAPEAAGTPKVPDPDGSSETSPSPQMGL